MNENQSTVNEVVETYDTQYQELIKTCIDENEREFRAFIISLIL